MSEQKLCKLRTRFTTWNLTGLIAGTYKMDVVEPQFRESDLISIGKLLRVGTGRLIQATHLTMLSQTALLYEFRYKYFAILTFSNKSEYPQF